MADIIKSDELPESLQIKSDKFTNSFQSIQLAMQEFWKEPLHNHYTRHDLEHSQRIINYIGKLLEENKELLNEQERFVIIAAALLHDIGMQGAKYAGFKKKSNFTIKDLEKIRKVHHITSAKMIADSITKGSELKLGIENCVDYADFITDISKYHRELDLKELKNKHFEGESVRLPLLASLLRFGDALDQDHRRVNVAQLKYREIPVNSKYYWWSHHFCSSIEIQDGKIRVHFRFPEAKKDDQIVDAFIGSVKSSVQNQLWEVYKALWNYKVKLYSQVEIGDVDYSGSSALEIPKDLLKHLEEKVFKIRKGAEELKGTSGAVWEVDGIPYSDDKEIVQCLDNIIRFSSEGKNRGALAEIKKARVLTKTPMQTMVFSLYTGIINYILGEESIKYYEDVLEVAAREDVRNVYGNESLNFKAAALGNIGLTYQDKGEPDKALKYYNEAMEIFRKIGYLQGETSLLNNIGIVYQDKGDPDEALKYHNRALEINRKIGYLVGETTTLGNIGLVYRAKGELDEALKCLKQVLEIHKKIGYLHGEASSLGNIGVLYREKSEPDEALKYHKQALKIHKKIGYLQGEARDLGNIGLVYQDKGEITKAIDCIEKTLSISLKINYTWSIANAHIVLSGLYLKAGEKIKSGEHKKEYEEIAQTLRTQGYKI